MEEEIEDLFLKLHTLVQGNDLTGVQAFLQDDVVQRMADFQSCGEDYCYEWSDIFTLACSSDERMDVARYMVDKCVSVCGERFLRHLLKALRQEVDDLLAGEDVLVARRLITLGADFNALTSFRNLTLLHRVINQPVLNLDMLVFLLDQGASLTVTTYNGLTPLDVNFHLDNHHCAATVAILDRIPQDRINALSYNEETVVMKAARMACPRCVEAFLERGADVSSAETFSGLPVAQYLNNVRGESTEELEAFRKLLRCTDKTKLKYLASLQRPGVSQRFFIPVAHLLQNQLVKYFDVIWEEGLQLLDFISARTCYSTFLRCFAARFHKIAEPYLTEINEVFLETGVLSEFYITHYLLVEGPNPRFFLFLLRQGLVEGRGSFSTLLLESLQWNGSLKHARRFIETMALFGELEIADNACLREARDRTEEECTLDEHLQQQCSLLGSKVMTLKRLSSNAIRQCFYECHGQVGLVPLVEQLNLPPVLADTILCRDIQCNEEDDSSSSSTSDVDSLPEDDESVWEDETSYSEDFEGSEVYFEEDDLSAEDDLSLEDDALSED